MQHLAVDYRPLEALIPYARNARTHSPEQVAQIAASIEEFGFTNPVLVDGERVVIAGNARLAAAKRLARETVPVTLATMRRCYPHAIGKGRSNPRSINPRKWLDTVAASAAPAPPKPAVGAVNAVLPNPSRAFRSAKYSVATKTHR